MKKFVVTALLMFALFISIDGQMSNNVVTAYGRHHCNWVSIDEFRFTYGSDNRFAYPSVISSDIHAGIWQWASNSLVKRYGWVYSELGKTSVGKPVGKIVKSKPLN